MDDQQFITLMQNDPDKGVEQAIRQYGGLCKAIAVRILGADHQQDIEECISDTFVKLWRAAGSIDLQKGTLKAYTASIARNTAINRLRRQKRVYELLPLEEDGLQMELDLESELSRKRNQGNCAADGFGTSRAGSGNLHSPVFLLRTGQGDCPAAGAQPESGGK